MNLGRINNICCINNCINRKTIRSDIFFFKFPKKKELRLKWIRACKLTKRFVGIEVVCEKHFQESDFIGSATFKKNEKILEPTAVPTKYLPKLWKNKFLPRTYGKTIKLIEFRSATARSHMCILKKYQNRMTKLNKKKTRTLEQRLSKIVNNKSTIEDVKIRSTQSCGTCGKSTCLCKNLISAGEKIQQNSYIPIHHNSHMACHICDVSASSGSLLADHVSQAHALFRVFQCPACSKIFRDEKMLKRHCSAEHSTYFLEIFSCLLCAKYGLKFPSLNDLNDHIESHNILTKIYTCKICQDTLQNLEDCWNHLNNHYVVDPGHVCKMCNYQLPSRDLLMEHYKFVHSALPKECRLCGKKVRLREDLIVHIQGHTIPLIGSKWIECKICGLMVKRDVIKKHIAQMHSYICVICKSMFQSEDKFIKHSESHNATLEEA